MSDKPRGYFSKLLVMDCETSGLAFKNYDPSIEPDGSGVYQSVSWGLAVVDSTNFKVIDTLYVEIKHNGVAIWSEGAERVHKMSKEYLEENGLSEEDAAVEIGEFILKHFGTNIVRCAGHNVATFDIWFMRRLLEQFDIMFETGNRFVDTNSIGYACYETYTSDQLFELMGVERDTHNAMEDVMACVKVLKNTRHIYNTVLGE